MSWDELRTRALQEAAKRSDLVLSAIGARFVEEPGNSAPGHCSHFFFEQAQLPSILDFLRRRLPDVAEGIIQQAEQICQHRFDLLGYRSANYGPQIDWHLDAIHGKRAPWRAWYKVPYLDFDQVGDSKITWELNRHQHLVTLAKAYRLTGHRQFALELFKQWYDWQRQNPYPMGINWASSLEVAFRSLSWLWVSRLLHGCHVVPARFLRDLTRALMLHGRHIARFPSTYFSPNTHLLGEGVGLFFIGTLCPVSPAAQLWRQKGWQIILQEARRQVWPDGMHYEGSTYYHTYALDFFLHARVLAGLNGTPIPIEFDTTIRKMLEAICRLGSAGSLPRLGDDDGGRVFDPRRNSAEHMLDPLALGALLFNRGDFKAVAGDIREETIWLSGVEAARRYDELPSDCSTPVSFALNDSGLHVMSCSEPVKQQLVINAGPRQAGRNGHRHADTLGVALAIDGRPVLIDPGTCAYVAQDHARDQFRGTAAHNTLHVDGLHEIRSGEPFGWHGLGSTHVNRWMMGQSFDFFAGSHRSEGELADQVEHERSIFYLKPHFWLVRDVVEGAGAHQLDIHWHFAEGLLRTIPGGALFGKGVHSVLGMLFTSNHPWSHEIRSDWFSPVYGSKRPAPLLRCSTEVQLPVELVSLLIPVATSSANPGVLKPFATKSEGTSVCAYRYDSATAKYLFVFAKVPGSWRVGPWSSDAAFFCCTASCDEPPDGFVMCDGSYLAMNGRPILLAGEPLKYAELFRDDDRQRFRCSNPDIVELKPGTGAVTNLSPSEVLTAISQR